MDKESLNVEEFFKRAMAVKEDRAKDYDNGGRSAYEISLSTFDENNRYIAGIWSIIQKASRLITLAQAASDGHFDAKAWDDTSKDLANYCAMQWCAICKPKLDDNSETDTSSDGIEVGDEFDD